MKQRGGFLLGEWESETADLGWLGEERDDMYAKQEGGRLQSVLLHCSAAGRSHLAGQGAFGLVVRN